MEQEVGAEEKAGDALFAAIARLANTNLVAELETLARVYDLLTSTPVEVTSVEPVRQEIHQVGETAMIQFDPNGAWLEDRRAAVSGFTAPHHLRGIR